jgi:hypothetical protein
MHKETKQLGHVIDIEGGVALVSVLDYPGRAAAWPMEDVQLPSAAFTNELDFNKNSSRKNKCINCDKELPDDKRSNVRKYCSPSCMNKYDRKKQKNERELRRIRYREIQEEMKKREQQ